MHIDTIGHGPDLVLIHGWAMHGGIFAPLTERLAQRCRLHRVDLPGHGASGDYAAGALEPAACVQAIAAATPPAVWLGWSLGGLVALRGALDRPDTVRGLVAIAANPRFVVGPDWPHGVEPDVLRAFADGLGCDYHATIERFLALETLGSPDAQRELRALRQQVFARGEPDAAVLCDGLDILGRTDLRAALPALATPSLWIAGRRDRLIPAAAMRWSAGQAPVGRYLELPAGHAPFLSDPQAVADAVADFVDAQVRA
jgi:pimeloyl-[acyl-carrier protein] methyl ester esterase